MGFCGNILSPVLPSSHERFQMRFFAFVSNDNGR